MPDPLTGAKSADWRETSHQSADNAPVSEGDAGLSTPIFDAHTHLDAMAQRAGLAPSPRFVAQVMAEARAVGVVAAITVGDTIASSQWCVTAAHEHPDVYAAVAVHPTEIAGLDDADYAELERLAADPRVVAVGETGLDYYWDRTEPAPQQEHFRRHIDLAKRVGKPLMIHDRDAHADVLRILREEGAPRAGRLPRLLRRRRDGARVRRGGLRPVVPRRRDLQERAGRCGRRPR